MTDFNSLCG